MKSAKLLLAAIAFTCSQALLPGAFADAPATQPSARASDRTADQIMQEFGKAVPQVDRERIQSDPNYRQEYIAQMQAGQKKQAELAREMLQKYPNDPRSVSAMSSVWMRQARTDSAGVLKEMEDFIASAADGKGKDRVRYLHTAVIVQTSDDKDKKLTAINDYIKTVPTDQNGAGGLLAGYAESLGDTDEAKAVRDRILKDYPESHAAKQALAEEKLAAMQGKPFDLSFTDAISGKTIDVKDLKGKVVVVDFWATWCGPCVGEMPHMKELYAKYKDQGVEFIGVSLDQPESEGGLKSLKEFVAKNEIGWPQYYQGKGWESEFSSGLGINSIPRVFVLDADGNLYSTQARGQLEQLIPELIEKRSAAKKTG